MMRMLDVNKQLKLNLADSIHDFIYHTPHGMTSDQNDLLCQILWNDPHAAKVGATLILTRVRTLLTVMSVLMELSYNPHVTLM